jgi:CHAD domain-containing protein
MSSAWSIELMIPPRLVLGDLMDRLIDAVNPSAGGKGESRLLRSYHDSFDWRLYREGLTFAVETAGDDSRLLCTTLASGEIQIACSLEAPMPRFAWDFPDGHPLRERLAPILDMRALMAQASIELVGRTVASPDAALCLVFANCRAINPATNDPKPLGDWLIVEAREEARQASTELIADLANEYGLEPAEAPLLLQALTAFGRRPVDPARQPDLAIDPALRADQATKAILRRLLAAIEINETGVVQCTDSEFLHDYRIAVRRTRSALGQIKGVFPDRTVQRFVPGFAWLGQITGLPRDLDVYLLGFEELKANLPPSLRDGLDPLREFLERRAERAHAELARQLGSRRYLTLLASWKGFLDKPVPKRPRAANARMPIRERADTRIWKIYRRALKQGRAIRPDTPAENLHELRKTCKKLRYLLEFFQSLYPADKIKQSIKLLKGLQDLLGEFQDVHAQIDSLHRFSLEMRQMNSVPTETLLAMGALLGQLDQRQMTLRTNFARRFDEFAHKDNQVHYRCLFLPQREVEDA